MIVTLDPEPEPRPRAARSTGCWMRRGQPRPRRAPGTPAARASTSPASWSGTASRPSRCCRPAAPTVPALVETARRASTCRPSRSRSSTHTRSNITLVERHGRDHQDQRARPAAHARRGRRAARRASTTQLAHAARRRWSCAGSLPLGAPDDVLRPGRRAGRPVRRAVRASTPPGVPLTRAVRQGGAHAGQAQRRGARRARRPRAHHRRRRRRRRPRGHRGAAPGPSWSASARTARCSSSPTASWWAGGPPLVPLSTVGAGDSHPRRLPHRGRRRPATACAPRSPSAARPVLLPGTAVPDPTDIDLDAVRVVAEPRSPTRPQGAVT